MRYKHLLLRSLLAAAFVNAAGLAGIAHADDFDDMRAKWALRGGQPDTSDPDVAARLTSINSSAQNSWNNMIRGEGRAALWPDLADFTRSATVTSNWNRLRDLTKAYYSPTSPLQGNVDLLHDIQDGISWLINFHYNSETVEYDNWYDWQIGSPIAFVDIMQMMYNDTPPDNFPALMASIQRFVPDPTRRLSPDGSSTIAIETGANLLDKCYIVAMHGMLLKLGDKLALARDSMSPALAYVSAGDGFYADGTFIQHTYDPYVGGYGGALLTDIGRLYYLLGGSPWDITDPNRANAFDWVMNAYRPFMYNGAMMDNQRGRYITRETQPDHLSGRGFVTNILAVTDSLPPDQSTQIKSVLKGWMQRDTSFNGNYFGTLQVNGATLSGGLDPVDITRLKSILNDSSIPAADEAVESRYYPSGGRALQRQPGHAFAVSTFSKRIAAFESGNGENLNGWWTGIGRTYLYNADLGQYSGNYWATSDMWRQPGTTTDHSGSGTPVAWKNYYNPRTGVGGAQLDNQFVAAGMEFSMLNSTGSALSGKKAWFLLGDKVVAMGTAITSTDGRPVETIVENRKLTAQGDNALTVNGTVNDGSLSWQESMAGVNWAHLAGNVPGADIGYVFPDAPNVNGLREHRIGHWADNTANGSTYEVADNYLSLALDHGVNPSSAFYTYITLPNRSAAETAAFAANTGITTLERSTGASAIKDASQGVTGAIFWNDSIKTVSANGQPIITSDKKAAVLMKQVGTAMKVSVADTTQLNTGVINVEFNRAAQSVVATDPGVTVVQTSPTIKLQVAVNGSAGKSFGAQFALSGLSSLAPAGDAYIRDGSSASSNFGTATTFTVKSDAVGFTRKGLIKFDLSGIDGTIISASLRLTPTFVGMSGITHNLYLSNSANWDESTVTWNTAPANASLVTSWAVPAVGTQVQADVTNLALAAMAGNKQMSFGIEAAQNYGANGSVDYASRTNSNTGYRPTLVITVQ